MSTKKMRKQECVVSKETDVPDIKNKPTKNEIIGNFLADSEGLTIYPI
jgi:hypothetical protein